MKITNCFEQGVPTRLQRRVVTAAVTAALGICVSGGAQALTVVSWDLQDFDNDGLRSDFAFFAAPGGSGANMFGFASEDCGGGPGSCVPMAFDAGPIAAYVFTTGFLFGGSSNFAPNVFGNIKADINGTTLAFSALDLGGEFPYPSGGRFRLSPDVLANCTGTAGCGTDGFGYNVETFTDLGGGDYGVVVRYVGTVTDPGSFINFTGNWRLEGVMSTAPVPVPAAVWLFGSGLAGLAGFARRKKRRPD